MSFINTRLRTLLTPLAVVAGLITAACSDSTSPEDTSPRAVTVNFKPMVGTAAFVCGQAYPSLGTSSSTGTPTEFMMYVSNVRLLKADGSETPITLTQDNKWQIDDVALLDFAQGGTGTACASSTADVNAKVVGTVPGGNYTGLRFDVGLPFVKNHGNQATAAGPLSSTAMFWSWNAGYIAARIDMRTTGKPGGWYMHVGSTGCSPSTNATTVPTSCTARNVATYTLTGFNASSNVVIADLKTLFATTNLDVDNGGMPGCMSGTTDPECATLFAAYGLGFNGGATPASQNFLRVGNP
ncbi:MAG: MbnP family copper-binding protein [Gemmatimonas sp.]